ncbi:MAG: shikimate kinase [Lachnospiraceae bacterium]|nr:shikimate kinase [Lachnospiraceae bacterium]
MGCGKSTIAAALGHLLGMACMEMDQQIVEQEGRSIADIFADQGEAYFRSVETDLLRSFSDRAGVIVSCGGGVPLREENIHIMKENGLVVFLNADAEIIYGRVKDSTDRPILNGHMNVEYIGELMDKRRPWYEKAADVCITVGHKSTMDVCVEILENVAHSTENGVFLRKKVEI